MHPAPDWNLVPFEVGCARCGHDLKGLTEPRCPACHFEFDWSDAVPLEHLTCERCGYNLYGLCETRCPECGSEFTWESALLHYRAGRRTEFEFHWRDRPLRSLISTVWRAARPRRFWRTMSLHITPRVRPLIGMVIVTGVISLAFLPIAIAIPHAAYRDQMGRRGGPWSYFPQNLAFTVKRNFQDQYLQAVMLLPLLWCAAALGALFIFRQSMRRYKVLSGHVIRVWAYTFLAVLPLIPFVFTMGFVAVIALDLLFPLLRLPLPIVFYNTASTAMVTIGFAGYAIRTGYKHYLLMPHGWGIAISSQLIGVLAAASACHWVSPATSESLVANYIFFLGKFLGVW